MPVIVVVVVTWLILNVAVQLTLADIVTLPSLQSASPLQALKIDPVAAAAVRLTFSPVEKGALQVGPQLIPAGLLVTVPLPAPALVMVRVLGGFKLNVAVQD